MDIMDLILARFVCVKVYYMSVMAASL